MKAVPETLQLKQANGIIEGFINACSHKFKSPLSSIEGLLLLAERCSTTAEIGEYLNLIRRCTNNMLKMISQLEEYITIQHRKLNQEKIEIEDIVNSTVSEHSKEIKAGGFFVFTNISQAFPCVSDSFFVSLILKHILDNAIQFSDNKKKVKKITIGANVDPKYLTIEVTDNGIGIPNHEHDKIFEPFHRSAIQSKGNGLGLFVVKGAAEKLKARITLKSSESIGTSFVIAIPNTIHL